MHRAYLKSVAKKLAEDVDNLKNTAGTMGRVSYHKTALFVMVAITIHTNRMFYFHD